jgi:SAM-dependent methyltransferase
VLDLGSGAGGSAALVAARFPEASVLAIDSSRRMLAHATARHQFPNLEFRHAPITVLPAADASIDLVVMLNAVPSIREVARVATADAQVLGASTYVGANAEGSKWMETWRAAGFTRTATGEHGEGHWDLLQRA